VQVSGRKILPSNVLLKNDLIKQILFIHHISPLHQNSFLHCIYCMSSLVFDIFTDVCVNCGNSTSDSTSKLKRFNVRMVWNLVWAFLLPVSRYLTPFLLDKLCHCIFSLLLSSDNICQSAPLLSSSLHKLCSRSDEVCLVKVITSSAVESDLFYPTATQTTWPVQKTFVFFFSSQAYRYLKKAALKHALTTKLMKNNAVFRSGFIFRKHATGLAHIRSST